MMQSLLSPKNASKIRIENPHVERFSLKTNWTLAERLLSNQGSKQYLHGVRSEGKIRDQIGTCEPGRGHRRAEDYMGSEILPWE